MSDKNTVTAENGMVYYRASQLGACCRSLTAARLGLPSRPPSDRALYYFAEGHLHEEAAKEYLRDEGWTIWGDQEEVILPISHGITVRGHMDGRVERDGWDGILEVKSAGASVFDRLESAGFREWLWSKPSYLWQISTYMHATGKPALYVVIEREDVEDKGQVIHTVNNLGSTSFDDLVGERLNRRVKVETLAHPPISRQDIRRRVLEIEVAAREEVYPDCDGERYFCQTPDLCQVEATRPSPATITPSTNLTNLVQEYAQKKALRDTLSDDLKEIKADIEQEAGEGKLAVGRYEATLTRKSRSRYDMDYLRGKVGNDEMEAAKRESWYTELRIVEKST